MKFRAWEPKPEPESEAPADQPEAEPPAAEPTKGLTPVEELGKKACLAELKHQEGAPFFQEVVGSHVPGDLDYKDCAVSLLREIVAEMRVEAEKLEG